MPLIDIISATRLPEQAFWQEAPLGISLRRLEWDRRLVPRIAYANSRGLPDIYNARIDAADRAEILLFVHDDVWIDDHFLAARVIEGLAQYDVIGIAGNRRRLPRQPGWAFIDNAFTWDESKQLSGTVGHGEGPFGKLSSFGITPAPCELLDGMFLAARTSALVEQNVSFDPRFDFHFYDLDFCRSARDRNLRLGTWPIALTHRSMGSFGSPAWQQRYADYLRKWGD